MKRIIISTIAVLLTIITVTAQNCDKLLEDGLYQQISIITRSTLNQDMRSYFLSQKFTSDMKEGKWGGSLAIPVKGVPISISSNSSDAEFKTFQQIIQKETSFSLNTSDYVSIVSKLPNDALYLSYNDCVKTINDASRTGLIKGKKIENEETVIFNFYFRPAYGKLSPKVTTFTIEPKSAIIDNGGIKKRKRLPSNVMSIVCRRSEVNEITINLQTQEGSYNDASGPTKSSKFEIPIGTVITSFLPFDSFRQTFGETGAWKKTSKWAPCDGRDISGSELAKYSTSATPDLRGLFLRGVNDYGVAFPGVTSVNEDQKNPDNSKIGEFQYDAIKNHKHNIARSSGGIDSSVGLREDMNNGDNNRGMGIVGRFAADPNFGKNFISFNIDGKAETRPKNMSIYYYIKIN